MKLKRFVKIRIASVRIAAALGTCMTWFPVSAAAGTVAGDVSVVAGKGSPKAGLEEVAVWLDSGPKAPASAIKPAILQRDLKFLPQLLVITVGQTVAMPNGDDIAHNVYSDSPARRFNLGIFPKGQSKDVTFPEAGIVELECSMHRKMKATIVVSPTPYHTIARAGGHYEIADVPPGTYKVRAWSSQAGEFRGEVTVPQAGAANLSVVLSRTGGK